MIVTTVSDDADAWAKLYGLCESGEVAFAPGGRIATWTGNIPGRGLVTITSDVSHREGSALTSFNLMLDRLASCVSDEMLGRRHPEEARYPESPCTIGAAPLPEQRRIDGGSFVVGALLGAVGHALLSRIGAPSRRGGSASSDAPRALASPLGWLAGCAATGYLDVAWVAGGGTDRESLVGDSASASLKRELVRTVAFRLAAGDSAHLSVLHLLATTFSGAT